MTMTSPAQPIQVHTTRSKHGHEWTRGDLHYYNILIAYDDAKTFFENPDSLFQENSSFQAPIPHTFDTSFFTALNPEDAPTPGGQAYRLIQHLDEAMATTSKDESASADFVAALLRALDFAPNEATIRTGKNFSFRVGREKRHSKADVCIVEGTNPLLIVQQDKSHVDPLGGDADARLIATAIAAYDEDSLYRVEYDLAERPAKLVGIVMHGSWPTFFKIWPVNVLVYNALQSKNDSIMNSTTIRAYHPIVARPQQRLKEGMKSLDNRKLLVDEFLRLKQLMLRTSGKRK